MRPVLALAALAALLSGFLAACSDDDPLRLSDDESASFSVHPQLSSFGASEMLPINLIRLTVVSLPDSAQVIEPVEFDVEPTDPSWSLHLDVPLVGGQPIEVLVFVELINETDGVRTVEWSGVAGPFTLEPGETAVPPTVAMFRGSVQNLAITAVTVAGADTTTEGATLLLRATAVGASSPQFFWSSLDPAILAFDSAASDSAAFLPLAPGLARIVVEAGPRADTLEVTVHARVTELALSPGIDTLTALLASATFGAAALDARGDTVPDVTFAWASSDSTVARSLGGGAFEARAQGTVTVTATTPLAPGLSASAELVVRQDVASIVVADPADTLAAGESTVLTAVPVDANDQPVEPATLTWSSADSGIVAIDSAGTNAVFVTARAAGTSLIEASIGGQSGIIIITVVPGAVASVVVTADSLTFDRLDASAQLTADVRDAEGNPTGDAVAWSSTDATIAAVDASGRVDADGNGSALIVAIAGGVADTAVVVVRQTVVAVDVVLPTPTLSAGGSEVASASAFDAGGAVVGDAVFAWSSSDTTVATVDVAGTVAARLVGSAWIRVASAGAIDSAQVTVIAGAVATVEVAPDSLSFATLGAMDTLTATSRDALGNDCGCTPGWTSRDATVATVDAAGVVTSVGNGTTWIVANVAGVTDSAFVDVQQVITAVVVTLPVDTMETGASVSASAVATDAASDTVVGASFAWSSTDSLVAAVDAAGVVTAGAVGSAWIRASAGGVADSALVTVIMAAPAPATIAWTGGTSTDWFDASNWNTGVLPSPLDTVFVFASAPFQPTLAAPDSIAGVITEDGAALTLGGATLVVADYVDAGSSILGAGALRVRGGAVSGGVPALQVAGQVAVADTLAVAGDLTFVEDFAELHVVFPTTVSGSVVLGDDAAFLHVGDSLDIGGALQVGAIGLTVVPELEVAGTVVIADSLLTTGNGRIETFDPLARIRVRGNARFESTFSSAAHLTQGTLIVGGDLRATGAALHATGMRVELDAAVDQHIALTNSGPLPAQARLHDLAIRKAGGIVYVDSDLYLGGSLTENAGYPVFDTAQVHTLTVAGDVDLVGALQADTLRLGGALLGIGGTLDVATTEFSGTAQAIPALAWQDVLVSGSGASWTQLGAIAGSLTVTGYLALAADLDVGATTTVVGAIQPGGNTLSTAGLTVAGGTGLVMTNVGDTVVVTATAEFLGGSSGLAAGTLLIDSAATFHSVGGAFRSSGTVLHMRGTSLDMEGAGPGASQGQLASLVLETPSLLLDSAYVTGDVTEAGPGGVSDAGGATWRALLQVGGNILTPNVGYALNHVSVGASLDYDFGASDVDLTQFTGSAQTIPVVDSIGLPLSHGTILVTGTDVHLGTDTDFLDIGSDVIVSGPGARLTVHSSDNGFVGSLSIPDGDATTRIVIHDAVSVRGGADIAAGVLDLAGNSLTVNDAGLALTALHTTGTGVIEMNDSTDALVVQSGDARFEGGSTDGLLTVGFVDMADSTTFYSRADAFRSTGTALLMRGDTIEMENAGFGLGQGQLASLQYFEGAGLEVVDSLYIAGNLTDAFGAMLHDNAGDALVVVSGDVVADSSQVVIDHVAIGGDLLLTSLSNWAVDTTEFTGTGQLAPLADANFGLIPYNVVLVTGDSVVLGTGSENPVFPSIIVRGTGASLVLNSQEEAMVDELRMEGGDPTQRVRLGNGYLRADSIVVASGVLDLNSFSVFVNGAATAGTALRTTGGGALEMNQPSDWLEVNDGDVFFEGGSTNGLLTDGRIILTSEFGNATSFHATGDAFHATGTHVRMDVDSLVIGNGGLAATQTRFAGITFGAQPQAWGAIRLDGHLVVEDSLVDYISGGSGILGTPASRLTVLGQFRTTIADLDIPTITAHQNLQGGTGSSVDVVELVGAAQTIGSELAMKPGTIVVGGNVTFTLDSIASPTDTIAGFVPIKGGALTIAGGGTGIVRDSIIILGGSLDLNGIGLRVGDPSVLDGALMTQDGGIFIMKNGETLRVNGDVDLRGGSTDGFITSGTLYVRGDFHAEAGAFQASGQHVTFFDFMPSPLTITMPEGGPTAGRDHFNDLQIATDTIVELGTDVYAIGDLLDWSDAPGTQLLGSGQTLHSDGWNVVNGFGLVDNVTLSLDDALNPEIAGSTMMNGTVFGPYEKAAGATRMRIGHAGFSDFVPLNIQRVDFLPSTDSGLYVDARDLDPLDGQDLLIAVTFAALQPSDWERRIQTDGVAVVTPP